MTTFVLLSAGKGSRLWPITEKQPKTMVRVLGKPILEWAVEGALPYASKIVVIIGPDGEDIREYFSSKPYASKLEFVIQSEQKGTGHAALTAKDAVKGDAFVVINADTFFDPSFYAIAGAQAVKGPFVAGKYVEDASPYGLIESKDGNIARLTEKPPAPVPGHIFTGCYAAESSFFELLEQLKPSPRGELEVTDALNEYAESRSVKMLDVAGYWNDVGYYWNFLDTSAYALENLMDEARDGQMEDFVNINGKLHLGKGSVILSGTYIQGPVFIGENCVVGPNTYLRPGTVLEGNNHVGNGTELKNTILGLGSNVPHLSYLGDSILCEDVNLGAGTTVANLKFDDSTVEAEIKGKKVDSRKRKLGAVIGSNTKVGINSSINCGVLIGSDCCIYPHTVVMANVESGSTVK
ncbi:hypothetical protein AUJ14_04240 [Candidatus Micrarchaeota archaeon CG1_02_55_22]|nr:MAG: hypothetical protein AUJ14_04240 [Candidatus Micrarchaeota archaeon CG1_02_55_22]